MMSMPKPLYPIGEVPPLGEVPPRMHAAVIRQERFGAPAQAFANEVVDTPQPGPGQVLVLVMAAGVNYNNVWASLGEPIDVIAMRERRWGATEDFHIGGTDGAGVVWAVGPGARQAKVGDEVVLSGGMWEEDAEDIRLGADPITSSSLRAWGYESNYGSFAQFTVVNEVQCHPKPRHLPWEDAACFLLTGGTAYRQLFGWAPHTVEPGDPVLIWGGAGGLGSMAIQLVRLRGGIPVAVVSSPERGEFCRKLGAAGYIDRTGYAHWGRLPDLTDETAGAAWAAEARRFGKEIWSILGAKRSPKIVLEHPGQDTVPTSMYVCDSAGMVVICGGTSGYNADVDLRYLWMRQKRLQGSHGANTQQFRRVVAMVDAGVLDPLLTWCGGFGDLGAAHQMLHDNEHPSGNMAVLVGASRRGLVTLGER